MPGNHTEEFGKWRCMGPGVYNQGPSVWLGSKDSPCQNSTKERGLLWRDLKVLMELGAGTGQMRVSHCWEKCGRTRQRLWNGGCCQGWGEDRESSSFLWWVWMVSNMAPEPLSSYTDLLVWGVNSFFFRSTEEFKEIALPGHRSPYMSLHQSHVSAHLPAPAAADQSMRKKNSWVPGR